MSNTTLLQKHRAELKRERAIRGPMWRQHDALAAAKAATDAAKQRAEARRNKPKTAKVQSGRVSKAMKVWMWEAAHGASTGKGHSTGAGNNTGTKSRADSTPLSPIFKATPAPSAGSGAVTPEEVLRHVPANGRPVHLTMLKEIFEKREGLGDALSACCDVCRETGVVKRWRSYSFRWC